MAHDASALRYRPEIDGLRALAVISVVLFHAGLACPGGYVGVDIFFVISGFLITSLLLRDFEAGTFSLGAFYERRARRILPASLTVTAVVLAAGYFRLLPLDLQELGYSAVAHVLCVANFFFYSRASNYFAPSTAGMPLLHMWSLAVEEQFYVLFPLLLWGCFRSRRFRRRRRAIGVMLILLLLVSLSLSAYGIRRDASATFFLLPTRAWELMVGGVLALLPRSSASRWRREGVSWIGLAGMLAPVFLYTDSTPFPGPAALPPCLGAALFIWANGPAADGASPGAKGRSTWAGRVLASPGPVFIGAISYSLYLWHWPVLVLAKYWKLVPLTTREAWTAVAISFVAAVASWALIERPFRRRVVCQARWSLFTTAGVAMALLLTVGGYYKYKSGLPARYSDRVNELDDVRRYPMHFRQVQIEDVKQDRLTRVGDPKVEAAPSFLLWGDSHAAAAMPAFQDMCRAHGIVGRAATHSSTPPLVDYDLNMPTGLGRAMPVYNQAVVDYVARERIKNVILVNFWLRDEAYNPEKLDAALGKTIAALRAAGAVTYVMLQVPYYPIEVPKALAYEAIHHRVSPAWRKTLADHHHDQAAMYALAKKYESSDCHFIDPAPAFNLHDGDYLSVANHGHSLYRDGHHLTAWGAEKVLEPFLEKSLYPELSDVPAPSTQDRASNE